jgi:hypothetical protein
MPLSQVLAERMGPVPVASLHLKNRCSFFVQSISMRFDTEQLNISVTNKVQTSAHGRAAAISETFFKVAHNCVGYPFSECFVVLQNAK